MSNTNHPGPLSPKDYLNLGKHGIAPVSGITLSIVSAVAQSAYFFNVLNIQSGNFSVGGTIILWPLYPGPPSADAVWQLTPDGTILCPWFPNLVIGVPDGTVCLVERNSAGSNQQWTFAAADGGYTITNNTLTTSLVTDGSGSLSMSAIDATAPTTAQLWKFLPDAIMPVNSFYIQSEGKPGGSPTPYVVTTKPYDDGLFLFATPWQPGAALQLWRFNTDGTIAQAGDLSESNIMTSNSTGTQTTDSVNLYPVNGTPTSFQQWQYDPTTHFLTVTPEGIGTIGLNVPSDNFDDFLITYETGGTNSEWYIFPEQSTLPGVWFYLQTDLNQNKANPTEAPGPDFVLTVASSDPVAGTPVQINQLQPGALSQLWQLTTKGYLINALNQNLYLSGDLTEGNTASLQASTGSPDLQYWCLLPNGMLVTSNGTSLQYLSVINAIDPSQPTSTTNPPMTNGEVTTYSYADISIIASAIWQVQPYEPDMSGQWFTIQMASETKSSGTPYLLSVADNWSTIQTMPPLGGNILQYGTAGINQLWRFTMEGNIVSALNPGLYLTGNESSSVYLSVGQPGNNNQVWTWGETWKMFKIEKTKYKFQSAVLLNVQQQLVLTGPGSPSINEPSLQQGPVSSNQYWAMLPHCPAYNQPTTIRATSDKGQYPGLFLGIEYEKVKNANNDSYTYSYTVIVGDRGADSNLSTWQFIYPGYIASALDSNIVLSVASIATTPAWELVYGPGVTAGLRSPDYQPLQLWEANLEGNLVNKQTGYPLVVLVDNINGSSTYTLAVQSPSDNNNGGEIVLSTWDFSTGTALSTAMVMPPVPFPIGDSTNAEAYASDYNSISEKLGLPGGIRAQYQNLAAPLSSYQSAINMMLVIDAQHTTLKDTTLQAVVQQLNEEITKVIAIQQFFTQANSFHQSLSQAQAMLVSELITICAFPAGPNTPVAPKKKKAWIWDMCEGLMYIGLNAAGLLFGDPVAGSETSKTIKKIVKNGLPVLANVISGSLTTTQAVLQNNSPSNSRLNAELKNAYNYELSVYQLQQSLLSLFESIGNSMGQMEMRILADWGKITAVYDMIIDTETINSLYWPASISPALSRQMLSGYAVKVLQTLIPSNPSFYINAYLHNAQQQGKTGLQQDQATFYGENMDGTQSQWVALINPDVMNQIWNYGVDPNDFYRQINGWDVLTKYPFSASDQTTGNACLVVTIYNMTSVPMKFDTSNAVNVMCTGTKDLLPFGAQQFAGFDFLLTNNNPPYFSPSGSFSVYETQTGNAVLSGQMTKNSSTDGSTMIINNIPLTFTSPYYLMKTRQSPSYLVNVEFIEFYIGCNPAMTNN